MIRYIITESKHEKLWYYTNDEYDSWSTIVPMCAKFDSISEAINIANKLPDTVEILEVSVSSNR